MLMLPTGTTPIGLQIPDSTSTMRAIRTKQKPTESA
jgi:hypothetical protein